MPPPFRVDVVTPEEVIWTGEAEFLVARTTEGEIGVYANHQPTMGALTTGAVTIQGTDGSFTSVGVHGGFLQIFRNSVTLLTDRAEITEGDKDAALRVAFALRDDVDTDGSELLDS